MLVYCVIMLTFANYTLHKVQLRLMRIHSFAGIWSQTKLLDKFYQMMVLDEKGVTVFTIHREGNINVLVIVVLDGKSLGVIFWGPWVSGLKWLTDQQTDRPADQLILAFLKLRTGMAKNVVVAVLCTVMWVALFMAESCILNRVICLVKGG